MTAIIKDYDKIRKLYSIAIDILEQNFNDNQEVIDLSDDENQYSEYKIQKFFI